MTLQKNERLVLQHLTQNARTTDSAIAERIGISTQAVGKIRHKLEKQGIIEGYTTLLNQGAIGLPVVTIGAFNLPPNIVQHEEEFRRRVESEPNIIYFHRIMHGGAHAIILFAFRSLEENEAYFAQFQRLFPGITIVNLQTSSWDAVWKSGKQDVDTLALRDQPPNAFKNIPCKCADETGISHSKSAAKARQR